MAYETGVATSQHDLLDKLRIFLVANGWAQNKWAVEGSGYGLCVQKELMFVNLRSTILNEAILGHIFYMPTGPGILCNVSSGYSAGSVTLAQPDSPRSTDGTKMACQLITDSTNIKEYHFFATENNFDVVVKRNTTTAGYFSLHVGEISEKIGNFYHCAYFTSQCAPYVSGPQIQVPFSARYYNTMPTYYGLRETSGATLTWYSWASESWHETGLYIIPNSGGSTSVHTAGFSASLLAIPASTSGIITLYPIYIGVYKSSTAVLLGSVSTLRMCNSTYVTNGDEITIGSDTWKLFRLVCGYGWAFKKVV
jgi:hypothetical protein